jgi:hypothetical protein
MILMLTAYTEAAMTLILAQLDLSRNLARHAVGILSYITECVQNLDGKPGRFAVQMPPLILIEPTGRLTTAKIYKKLGRWSARPPGHTSGRGRNRSPSGSSGKTHEPVL